MCYPSPTPPTSWPRQRFSLTFPQEAVQKKRLQELEQTSTVTAEESEPQPVAVSRDDIESWRRERIATLKAGLSAWLLANVHQSMRSKAQDYLQQGHGAVETVSDEKEAINIFNSHKRVICHFYHDEFTHCKVLHRHLTTLAAKHLEVKFIRMLASKAPFFTKKLDLHVLPTMIYVLDGAITHVFTGFEEFKGDNITVHSLRAGLLKREALTTEMPVLKRLGEDVLVSAFKAASSGKSRLPLRRAFSELVRVLYGDDEHAPRRSADFMNEFYLRGVDVRCGLRSHALMVGGPKNLRGNPGGGLDARLFYPSITCEQFVMIGRAMECVVMERQVPHLSGGRVRAERTTGEVAALERRQKGHLLATVANLCKP
ncbi:thioredoxin domain containing protein, putative [Babesia caballi]|uniref:Thioredoxin domain containing protein, putative n=1 Tax=Babesia caballi TaxID=5871 RepID=A0AAV4M1E3_BABCB|nr:thioredoxin domain containing protein, putative [Babesia caballi]